MALGEVGVIMFEINDDVALVELFSHARSLGTVTSVNDNTYVVTGIGTGLTVVFDADDYQKVEQTPVYTFYKAEAPTAGEVALLARNRLLAVLNARWQEFNNSDPTLAKVRELAGLLESFEF